MKYVPNTLSTLRILLAASLVLMVYLFKMPALGALFLIIYSIAGFTDLIDGPIARKFNVTSKIGANLDGIADYVFVAAALITIIPALDFNTRSIVIVLGFVGLKIVGMIVGVIHYRQLMMMHTYASKGGAFFALLFPIIWAIGLNENTIIILLGIVVYFFLLEEIAINIVMPTPKRDIKGFYEAVRIRRQLKEENA